MTEKPKPKRRWFRFSLKTLLIVVVLMGGLLGWIAKEMVRAERQRMAVGAIEKAGGTVTYDWEVDESGMPMTIQEWPASAWLRERLGPDFLTDVVVVELSQPSYIGSDLTGTSDGLIDHIKGLTDLKSLNLAGTQITDDGLEYLKSLTNLESLSLHSTQVTDAVLEHLKELLNLQLLILARTQVTDAGLEHLKGLLNLRELYLSETQVTDAGLEHLKGLTNLLELDLFDTQVTEEGIEELQKALPNCRIFWDEGDAF